MTFTANAAGTGGNSYAVSEGSFSALSPTGEPQRRGVGGVAAECLPRQVFLLHGHRELQ